MRNYLKQIEQYNNTPLEEFQGLTPNQMDALIKQPFGKFSPIRFKEGFGGAVLDNSPYFRLTEEFLKIIGRDGKLKLTATNSIPPKVIGELYSSRFIKDPLEAWRGNKQLRERESEVFTTLNITTRFLPFVKRQKGEFVFTKAGTSWLETMQRDVLLKELLKTFTEKFNWAYNDGFPEPHTGQIGWAYTIFLLLQYGATKRPVKFYSDLYFKAFPQLIKNYPIEDFWTPESACQTAFTTRAVDRFIEWFGFAEVSDFDFDINKKHGNIQRTEILTSVFEIFQ